jgi:hypothetical protein
MADACRGYVFNCIKLEQLGSSTESPALQSLRHDECTKKLLHQFRNRRALFQLERAMQLELLAVRHRTSDIAIAA